MQANELRPTTSRSLSAAAPSFSPASPPPPSPGPPPPDLSSNDFFSQTGASQDALFDNDNVTQLDESMRIRSEDDLFSDDFTPVPQPAPPSTAAATGASRGDCSQRGRGGRGGRARGRGNGPPRVDSRESTQAAPRPGDSSDAPAPATAATPEIAPTGPRKDVAVRGDRRATGGAAKPRLTEAELADKITAIRIRNAELTASHARAEADAASFAEREAAAKQKAEVRAKEERRDRREMMGEREKNRERKLRAQTGREWDVEKNQEDFGRGGKFDKRGGFTGDRQDYSDGREYLLREPRGGSRGRGGPARGGRGRQEMALPRREDFPALPSKAARMGSKDAKIGAVEELSTSAKPDGRSWAEQVESVDS